MKMTQFKKYRFLPLFFVLISSLLGGCATVPKENKSQSAAYARVQVALGYLQQHQYEAAKQSLDRALQHDADYYLPYLVLAHYYQLTGNNPQAESHYRLALQKDPNQGDIYNNYAAFLCQQGSFAEAFKNFELALNSPDYYRLAQTYENTALCAHQAGDLPRQNEALDKLNHIDSQLSSRLKSLLK